MKRGAVGNVVGGSKIKQPDQQKECVMNTQVEKNEEKKSDKKQKKQQKVKTRKKHDPMRTEASKCIRMLRNAQSEKATKDALKRAEPMKAEIRRRAPAVARKLNIKFEHKMAV